MGANTFLSYLKVLEKTLTLKLIFLIPVDLSKLSDTVKNDVVKKAAYDKLVAKVNDIDTSDFVLKTNYQTEKTEWEKKILMWVILLKKQNSLN